MVERMTIICPRCNSTDLPENYHYVEFEDWNEGVPMKMYYAVCPQCFYKGFITHFLVDIAAYDIPQMVRICVSHKYNSIDDQRNLSEALGMSEDKIEDYKILDNTGKQSE